MVVCVGIDVVVALSYLSSLLPVGVDVVVVFVVAVACWC